MHPEITVVYTEHRSAHRIDRMRDGQIRAQILHERGQKLQRIASATARNLNDQQKHAQRLAEVSEGHHQGVDDEGEHQPGHPETQHVEERAVRLNLHEEQLAQPHQPALEKREQSHDAETTDEQLLRRRIVKLAHRTLRRIDLQGHHHEQGAYP